MAEKLTTADIERLIQLLRQDNVRAMAHANSDKPHAPAEGIAWKATNDFIIAKLYAIRESTG